MNQFGYEESIPWVLVDLSEQLLREPDAGEPRVQFDERAMETDRRSNH